MVKLLFPNHAQYRLSERGISIEHIKQAIKSPDFTEPTFEGRVKVRKKVDSERVLEVIYYRQGFRGANDYVIITAYYQPIE
jgi:hypothetical protein